MITKLIRGKIIQKYKIRDKYYHVIVDGTGLATSRKKSNSNKSTLSNDTNSPHTQTIAGEWIKFNKGIKAKIRRDKPTTQKTAYLNNHKLNTTYQNTVKI